MAKVFDEIDAKLEAWIAAQPMFFVATAPAGDGGLLNLSPKGYPGTFRVLGPRRVAYLDTVGSGIETIAHLRENGRIVIMFCAFAGPPRIVRLHGRGTVVQAGELRFDELAAQFDLDTISSTVPDEALRSVIDVDVTRIGDSCGFGVPLMQLDGWRSQGREWAANRIRTLGPAALADYQREKNAVSLDGLPGIDLELLGER
jgi:hypothetical protein